MVRLSPSVMDEQMIDQQHAFLMDLAKLLQQIETLGLLVTGGELWRSPEVEAVYVQEGKSHTLHSNHTLRLAIDLNFFKDGLEIETPAALGVFWEKLHPYNRWGGDFASLRDLSHFERNLPAKGNP